MEHHANIVPWMILSEELGGLDLRYIPIDGDGRLVLDDLDRLVDGVKVVGVSRHVQRARHHQPGARRSPTAAHARRRASWWPTARSWCRTPRST